MPQNLSKTWAILRWLPLLLPLMGLQRCPISGPNPIPTLTCNAVAIQISPGECVEITNPCGDNQWHRLDSFRLDDSLPEVYTRSERNPRKRFLCAATGAQPVTNEPVDYFYQNPTDYGEGTFTVTVGQGITVTASATPTLINPGDASQLDAFVTNGAAPVTFSWTPAGSLDDPTFQSPIATPINTTNYVVTVTDSRGLTASAAVTVNVGAMVTVTADSPIDAGQSSNLLAIAAGGIPPYTFEWSPAGSLDDPTSQSPVATPANTTEYDVTLTDSFGLQAFGSVTVVVNIAASASANPSSIDFGEQSQLTASVSGGQPPYTFSWSPAASLDDFMAQNPVAEPLTTTNYLLIVTDALGDQGTAQVQVDVQPAGGLTAVLNLIPIAPVAVQPDGSASTGPIETYRFWCNWTGAGLPDFELGAASGGTDPAEVCAYDNTGTFDIRLEVVDALGNTDAVIVPFTVGP